jgi:hypothetical protein
VRSQALKPAISTKTTTATGMSLFICLMPPRRQQEVECSFFSLRDVSSKAPQLRLPPEPPSGDGP